LCYIDPTVIEFSTCAVPIRSWELKYPVTPETERFAKSLESKSPGEGLRALVGMITKRSIPFVLRRRR